MLPKPVQLCRQEMKSDSEHHMQPAELEPNPDAMGTSSTQAREPVATCVRRGSLQFGDGEPRPTSSGSKLSSTAVLELLKEESDLLEDDEEEPMSFMKPTLSLRKGMQFHHCCVGFGNTNCLQIQLQHG